MAPIGLNALTSGLDGLNMDGMESMGEVMPTIGLSSDLGGVLWFELLSSLAD